ncbi:LysR family transcriptional regulator [Phyllobacterium phragmitis]|uniref:LysR family transcriptional regulator n=2 Tax=Phyllobacterium phragmitis TaxID=2670329 RepID=A0A2S9IWT8_9HYPH|nr:LysR family transcriptional regulator [Phyllobacterium phragmitis]
MDPLHNAPAETKRLPFDLDWNLLRTFLVIVETGGITAAANRLRLKQPTISNALKRLEDRLQKRLIHRDKGHFEVTQAGQLLYKEALEIFGNVSRLSILIRDLGETITGHVTLALASHVVSPVLDEALAEFHRRHPRATFGIEVMTSSDIITSVLQRQASFGVCLVHERHEKLVYRRLFREYFGFFCGPAHRLFGVEGLKLADLRGETSVSFKTDRLTDALRPVALIRAEAELDAQVVGVSSNLEEVRRMIVAGLGIGPLPVHVAARDVADGQLWRLPPYESPPAIDIYVVHNPKTHHNRAERGFLDLIHQRIEELPIDRRDYVADAMSAHRPGKKQHR